MVVSLYTTRVVLNALGASDYGLYNIVGGVISILSVFTVLVSSGLQRFLNFEMGMDAPSSKLREIFTASLTIYLGIYVIILFLGETVGLWFVNRKLIIPNDRLYATNIVYQVTLLQLLFSFIQSAYTSAILAHERMDVYGYVGVGEPILRLCLVLLLPYCFFDKLVVYSLIVFIIGLASTIFYVLFCKANFEECRFHISNNIEQIKRMLSFTVWNLFEALSNTLSGQGLNILLNLFFGPIINAARAIAFQVNNAVHGFASNFLVALSPQITKYYASGDINSFHDLMIKGSRFAFIVLSIMMIPIFLNTEYILQIWLKNPPEYASKFVQLVMLAELVRMTSEPLYTGIQATGKIKVYQIVTNSITLINLPLCYFLLKECGNPMIVFYTTIGVSLFFVISRLFFIHSLSSFPLKRFICIILSKCVVPFILAYIPLFAVNNIFQPELCCFILISIFSIIWSVIVFSILSLEESERGTILRFIKRK